MHFYKTQCYLRMYLKFFLEPFELAANSNESFKKQNENRLKIWQLFNIDNHTSVNEVFSS